MAAVGASFGDSDPREQMPERGGEISTGEDRFYNRKINKGPEQPNRHQINAIKKTRKHEEDAPGTPVPNHNEVSQKKNKRKGNFSNTNLMTTRLVADRRV